MGVRRPLGLRHLDERLIARARLGVGGVERFAGEGREPEHQTVGAVRVVRDGDRLHSRGTVALHPRPQLLGIHGVEPTEGELRDRAAAEDDIAVQVLVLGAARELVGDEGGEAARLVVALGRGNGLAPRGADDVEVQQPLPVAQGVGTDLAVRLSPVRPGERSRPDRGHQLGRGVGRDGLLRIHHRGEHPEEAGVIGHRVEVERRVEPDLEPRRMGQRLAPRVTVGVVRCGARPVEERVVGEVRMDVEVAEIGVPQRVGRRVGCRRLRGLRERGGRLGNGRQRRRGRAARFLGAAQRPDGGRSRKHQEPARRDARRRGSAPKPRAPRRAPRRDAESGPPQGDAPGDRIVRTGVERHPESFLHSYCGAAIDATRSTNQ